MGLTAYFDDSRSGTGSRDLVLAGLVEDSETWTAFGAVWTEALAKAPTIHYLKMVEAHGLRGQFGGWPRLARDKKLDAMMEVLERFRPRWSFDVAVSHADYDDKVSPSAPRGLSTPYLVATFGAVSAVAKYLAAEGVTSPVGFVFDSQEGVSADVDLFLDYMVENLDLDSRALTRLPVIYGDDVHTPQLQAADMLAWHIRRQREHGNDPSSGERADRIRSSTHIELRIPADAMTRWGTAFAQVLPILQSLKSKGEWNRLREVAAAAKRAGFRPPHGGDDIMDSVAEIRAAWEVFRSSGRK